MSRPKLDEATTQKICDLLRAGNYLDTAATAAGVHKTTLHRWLRLGREQKRGRYKKFVEAVEKAQGEAEARDVALIAKQAPTDWRPRWATIRGRSRNGCSTARRRRQSLRWCADLHRRDEHDGRFGWWR